jgi:hypothetical protein
MFGIIPLFEIFWLIQSTFSKGSTHPENNSKHLSKKNKNKKNCFSLSKHHENHTLNLCKFYFSTFLTFLSILQIYTRK